MSEILAKVIRGETLESVHRGHLIVVEGNGDVVAQMGDPRTVTFWRSAAKFIQAMPFLVSGAYDTFGFNEKELALACASHAGEKIHTDLAKEMLLKIGLAEGDLRCGAHPSMHKETADEMLRTGKVPSQLNNNCSGKHAAMLACVKHIGADLKTYLSPNHVLQKKIVDLVSVFTDTPVESIKFGTDGCSAPNFAVPISTMAKAFAKLVSPPREFEEASEESDGFTALSLSKACKRIVEAQMKYPEYVGGSVRLDTKIMRALPGKLVCKIGAEGVWSAGVLPCEKWKTGLGIAIKIEDGNDYRARPVVAVDLLKRLGILETAASDQLSEFMPMKMKNRMNVTVGEVIADIDV